MTIFAVDIQADPLVGRLAFGTAAVAFVLGVVEMERRRPVRLPSYLALGGAASYAVYLVHPVALSFLVQSFTRILGRSTLPLEIVLVAMAILAAIAGTIYHLVIEKPLTKVARRAIQPAAPPAHSALRT